MTLEKHLEQLASVSDSNMHLYKVWGTLKYEITQILVGVTMYFPHFSLHDSTHSATICNQIERMLGEKRIERLSISDTWMLLMTIYCHDLGMALRYEDIYRYFQSEQYQKELQGLIKDGNEQIAGAASRLYKFDYITQRNETDKYKNSIQLYNDIILVIQNHFRYNHANRSVEYIQDMFGNRFKITNTIGIRFIKLLGEICKLHQEKISNIMELPYKTNGIVDDYMHPRFIALMLCLGDLLDLDTDRFNEYILEATTPLTRDSELHLEKHKSIQHFLIDEDGIEICSDAQSIEVYRLMRDWVSWMEEAIEFATLNWSDIAPYDFGKSPKLRQKELLMGGNKKWLEFADCRFSISQKRAIELLQGANIYNDKFVCCREVLQNAVDATLLQIWVDFIRENENVIESTVINIAQYVNERIDRYNVKLTMGLENNEAVIRVRDYGVGISEEDIRCIANIGNQSNSRKAILSQNMPEWLRPSGVFGLGLQSIFLVTDMFQIITKADNEATKCIVLENGSKGKGYIYVEDYKEYFERGTEIIIRIDSKKINRNDLNVSEYYYRTEALHKLILDEMASAIQNVEATMPLIQSRKTQVNYVPINGVLIEKENSIPILKYESIFADIIDLCEGIMECNEGNISFQYFDREEMCICEVRLRPILNKDNYCGEYTHSGGDLRNSIFYKNVFVMDVLHKYLTRNSSIYRESDFSINILASNAEELLNISRNGVNTNFEKEFIKLYENSLKNTMEKLIDKIIDKKEKVDSTIIRLLLIAKEYNYREDELVKLYNQELNQYVFGNYFTMDGEKKFTFKELYNHEVTFILNPSDENIETGLNIDKDFILINHRGGKTHVLPHQIKKIFIQQIGERYYTCIKTEPFYYPKQSDEYEKDNFMIIYDFLVALVQNRRCIRSNKKYMNISTSIGLGKYLIYDAKNSKAIELPMDKIIREKLMRAIREQDTSIVELLEEIFKSEIFEKNIKYISDINKLSEKVVRSQYTAMLNEVIQLVVNPKYSEYIKQVISDLEKITSTYSEGIYEKISYNNYINIREY